MKTITVEEHFATEEQFSILSSVIEKKYPILEVYQQEKLLERELLFLKPQMRETVGRLYDIGEGRLREMDEAGIDMQVLSLVTPGVQPLDPAGGTALARKVNDKLSEAVRRYPERFAGLASIAPQDPAAAATELERAVKELGLKGASINSHTKGEYLDDKKYWPIFEKAEELGVPIYIHPRLPSPGMLKPYLDYPFLDSAMCGFAHEVSLHALRLICSGLFDQYPNLNLILGHMGETLPYWLWRIDNMWQRSPEAKKLEKLPSNYFKDNFFITTSGMFWQPPLICACLVLGADRILFAIDYPNESAKEGVRFIKEASICDNDKEKICHLNAERLFSL
jgi:5-carboxyvanillate decarboxylase